MKTIKISQRIMLTGDEWKEGDCLITLKKGNRRYYIDRDGSDGYMHMETKFGCKPRLKD